jgi:peptidoglycan/xylan/chitin deacetylase (PgdA/CDA1 family)
MRVVIFSSETPSRLDHLLWRLALDLPEITIAGVLYETPRPALPFAKRVRRAIGLLTDVHFVGFVFDQFLASVFRRLRTALDSGLRLLHAGPREPNGPALTLDRLVAKWTDRAPFHVTNDIHGPASLDFARQVDADLGLIYATRILKPVLFGTPRRGSINIHKHKLPDYRGSGASGLWELRDNCDCQTVTVHRVVEAVDAGAIVGERTFRIEPFDTLQSIQLKADVIGADLIVDVLRDEHLGRVVERPQPPGGQLHKGWARHRIYWIERAICRARPRWRPGLSRPVGKLIARLLLLPAAAVRNWKWRRAKRFPIVVLFHHLTCDRPKFMAIPTAEFARHVRYLKRHYRIVSLQDAIGLLRQGDVAMPTVVLTFDDGYADNLLGLRAVAELERVPVTICVCTEHVSDRSELAHDIARGERGFRSMGWEDVLFLQRRGFTIASHTRTHFDCGHGDLRTLADEIAGSKRDLESVLGQPMEIFAFPKGRPANMSPLACELAVQHYPVVMSASGGANFGPMAPPIHLQRSFHPDTLLELELQVQQLLDVPLSCLGTRPVVARVPTQTPAPASSRTYEVQRPTPSTPCRRPTSV